MQPQSVLSRVCRDFDPGAFLNFLNFVRLPSNHMEAIARVYAQYYPRILSGYFSVFHSLSLRAKVEIVDRLISQSLTVEVIRNFQLYQMSDEWVRFYFAQKLLSYSPEEVISYLNKFDLRALNHNVLLGKQAAELRPAMAAQYFHKFSIQGAVERICFLLRCLFHNVEAIRFLSHFVPEGTVRNPFKDRKIEDVDSDALQQWSWEVLPGLDCSEIWSRIESVKDSSQRSQERALFVAVIAALRSDFPYQCSWLNSSKLIHSVLTIRNRGLSHALLKDLFRLLVSEIEDAVIPVIQWEEKFSWWAAGRIPLLVLMNQGVSIETVVLFWQKIGLSKSFKDISRFHEVVSFLRALGKLGDLDPVQKEGVMLQLASDLEGNLGMMRNFISLGYFGETGYLGSLLISQKAVSEITQFFPGASKSLLLRCLVPKISFNDLNRVVVKVFQDRLRIQKDLGWFYEKFRRYFSDPPIQNRFLAYASKIHSIGIRCGNVQIENSLALFVNWVLSGRFKQMRYNEQVNLQVAWIQARYPRMLGTWKSNFFGGVSKFISVNFSSSDPQLLLPWLRNLVAQDSQFAGGQFPRLARMLLGQCPKKEELKIREELNHHSGDENLLLEQEFALLLQSVTVKDQLFRLERLHHFRVLKNSLLNSAIWRLILTLRGELQAKDISNKVVTFTDNYLHLVRASFDIQDSCLRSDGDPRMGMGNLGLWMHGQTKVIAIISENQEVEARAWIRLLQSDQRPVLCLDSVYPRSASRVYRHAILNVAKKIRDDMGVLLTSIESEDSASPFVSNLGSCGGPAVAEHVDGLRRVVAFGQFTIPKAWVVN